VVSNTANKSGEFYEYLNEHFTESVISLRFLFTTTLTNTTVEVGLEYSLSQFVIDFCGYIGLFAIAGYLSYVSTFINPLKKSNFYMLNMYVYVYTCLLIYTHTYTQLIYVTVQLSF